MEWKLITTLDPTDGEVHIRGLWVINNETGVRRWDQHMGLVDDENGDFVDHNGDDFGWQAEDYSHWSPLLPAPTI